MGRTEEIDLDRLGLSSGQGRRLELELEPGRLELGADSYEFARTPVPGRLEISRTAAGYALRLRFSGQLAGPCMRCLDEAHVDVAVDAREVDQPSTRDEELLSPYVEESRLDVGAWAHDSLALALPAQLLCREDCAGLCPDCGESLNDAPPGSHQHPQEPDPRWAKLRELQ